jgi:trigger factor
LVNIQKQYGQLISKTEASKDDELTGVFFNDEEGIESTATFHFRQIKRQI